MTKKHEIVIYFASGKMLRIPPEKAVFLHLNGKPDCWVPPISDGKAVINLDEVCWIREWQEPPSLDD